MALGPVLLHSWIHSELASYSLLMVSVRATKEGFVCIFLKFIQEAFKILFQENQMRHVAYLIELWRFLLVLFVKLATLSTTHRESK